MLKNYLKITLRNLAHQKIYSTINILGLSIGLACCLLIYLFVADELSFDRFHQNADAIYRVNTVFHEADGSKSGAIAVLPFPAGPALAEYFDEVESAMRVLNYDVVLRNSSAMFRERVTFTDPGFFRAFSFKLLAGTPENALAQTNAIVLTSEMAMKYFGIANPLGKTLTLTFSQQQIDLTVTGIVEKPPSNSTIRFDILVNFDSLRLLGQARRFDNWGGFSTATFVLLQKSAQAKSVSERLDFFKKQFFSAEIQDWREQGNWKGEGDPFAFQIQNIKDIHLDPSVQTSDVSDPIYSIILSGIALIVLLIAAINFMNLAVGRAASRTREIGMRKVLGAKKQQLINQFWSEAIILAFISTLLGLLAAWLLLPVFNELAAKELSLQRFAAPLQIGALLSLTTLVGILTGSYPALVMARFRPIEILKGKFTGFKDASGGRNFFTKSLVVVQFALSVFLIVSTIIMGQQLEYMRNKNIGFDKQGVIVIDTQERSGNASRRLVELFKQNLGKYPQVQNATAASASFGKDNWSVSGVHFNDNKVKVRHYNIDYDYLATLKIELLAGRNFSKTFTTDTAATIINEKLAATLELEAPLGQTIHLYGRLPMKIIGIVKDYNFDSAHNAVQPAMLYVKPSYGFENILVRLSAQNISETIAFLQQTWQKIQPDKPFIYSFLDEDLETFYYDDKRWSAIVRYSTYFAVLISCMGIFGLTMMSISRRVKEIGIRKVLGANVTQIVELVMKQFVLLVGIANVLAWPIAWWGMNRFLQNFYYRINIELFTFVLAGVISISIAVLTILFLALKSANANPVEALRYE